MATFKEFRKLGPNEHRTPVKPSIIKKTLFDILQSGWKIWVVADEMLSVVYSELFYIKDNVHVRWLTYTLERIRSEHENDSETEVPGMLYGMIFENIRHCLLGYSAYIRHQFPDVFRAMQTREDAEFYFTAACDGLFVHEGDYLKLIKVQEVIDITADLLMEDPVRENVYFENVNVDMAAHILNVAEKDEKVLRSLGIYKQTLKDSIRKYLTEEL